MPYSIRPGTHDVLYLPGGRRSSQKKRYDTGDDDHEARSLNRDVALILPSKLS